MIKIGLIGCGCMGNTHLTAYRELVKLGYVSVVAMADLDEKKTNKYISWFDAKIYKDGKDLIENADINLVDICLPTFLHFEFAKLAIEKGYNIMAEKPLCLNSKDAYAIAELAKNNGVQAMVGQCIRFSAEYSYLKDIVNNKTFGNIKHASFKRLSARPTWGWENWFMDINRSQGAALDLHIHDIDFVLYLLGEPNSVTAKLNKTGMKNSYIISIYEYDNFPVLIEGSWDFDGKFPFEMAYTVTFDEATIVYSSTYGLKTYMANGEIIEPKLKNEFDDPAFESGNVSSVAIYFNELKYYMDCLHNNIIQTRATFEDGARAVKYFEKEIESANQL